jgi:hypothetical protein
MTPSNFVWIGVIIFGAVPFYAWPNAFDRMLPFALHLITLPLAVVAIVLEAIVPRSWRR